MSALNEFQWFRALSNEKKDSSDPALLGSAAADVGTKWPMPPRINPWELKGWH